MVIELQSQPEHYMVLRLLTYAALLYEELLKQDERLRRAGLLPPVLPLVLYSGERNWKQPTSLQQLYWSEMSRKLLYFQIDMIFSYYHKAVSDTLARPCLNRRSRPSWRSKRRTLSSRPSLRSKRRAGIWSIQRIMSNETPSILLLDLKRRINMDNQYFVYIMTHKPEGVFYIGVTHNYEAITPVPYKK